MQENAIETIDLTKSFKSQMPNGGGFLRHQTVTKNAVDHLSFEIKRGELFGLLGPNGAGKTTLVKMLCTLLPPDGGTARVNGYDIVKQQMKVKSSLGTLFSVGERGFFWRLNGYRNLEFFASIYNVPRRERHDRILEVLRLVGLENSMFQLFQKYSGGMKRKLALARSLLPDPPIVMLDEPTTGLDAISSRNVRDFVVRMVKETGKTVLYTTHYIEEAAQICTKIGILKQGKIIACDSPSALVNRIKKGEQIYLVLEEVSSAQIDQMLSIQGVDRVTVKNGEDLLPNQKGLLVELKSLDHMPSIFDFVFEQKIKLVNFKREEPSLEDAFIQLTKSGA